MAAFQIAPPEKFNLTQPDEWLKWIRQFERFREASVLDRKAQSNQVNTLLYCMDDKADDIVCSLNLTADEKRFYETVKTKLEGHFIKSRNSIFERAKFNQRWQERGESVDFFYHRITLPRRTLRLWCP